MVQY